jgi:hypothetical protein
VTKATKAKDSRLQRRLVQIEKLERRQIRQLIDAFIERGQLKRKFATKQPA